MSNKLALGLILGLTAAGAVAQTFPSIQADPVSSAYLQDSRGVILRSETGLCWRTGSWASADAAPGCDGELIPPVAKPTAPAIVAPPLAQIPAAPAAPKRCDFTVTLSGDQAFASGKAVLNRAAKKRLDEDVIPGIAGCRKVEAVLVTGHTDHLGSRQQNQRLSEQRANAVAAYLKDKGITAPVTTTGAGPAQALSQCSGKRPRSKLVDCLAPNRRVVIEIRGISG
ncbi:OmpA family protein [Noviherbaspirillum massiliense]|uniref:OmpA family protein n=1 Tax=Noviherbaspirillum massiliense TaxID=1465823 RepID=UPI00030171F1|nr:OmpA family protein [Noviherbaspirillum massiliense]